MLRVDFKKITEMSSQVFCLKVKPESNSFSEPLSFEDSEITDIGSTTRVALPARIREDEYIRVFL